MLPTATPAMASVDNLLDLFSVFDEDVVGPGVEADVDVDVAEATPAAAAQKVSTTALVLSTATKSTLPVGFASQSVNELVS